MADNVTQILAELSRISPMPADEDLNEEILVKYLSLLKALEDLHTYSDKRIIPAVIASFGYGTGYEVYWTALHLLEKFGRDAVDPELIKALRSEAPGVRMWSASMLGRSRNREAEPALISLLSDPMELVRHSAINALAMIDLETNMTLIKGLADDPSPSVRYLIHELITSSNSSHRSDDDKAP